MRFKLILTSTCLLVGCAHIYGEHGLIKKRSNENYKYSHSEPALQLPRDLTTKNMSNDYPIPQVASKQTSNPVSIVPPGHDSENLASSKNAKRSIWGRVKDWF